MEPPITMREIILMESTFDMDAYSGLPSPLSVCSCASLASPRTESKGAETGMTLLTSLRALRAAEFSSPRAEDLAKSKEIVFAKDQKVILVPDLFGQTAMHYLAALRMDECATMLKALCEANPKEIDRRDDERDTALHEACRTGNLPAVRVLVESSASCAAKGLHGRSPLLMAGLWLQSARLPSVVRQSSEIVTLLTEHSIVQGVSFDEADKYGVSINSLIAKAPSSVGASVRKGIAPVRKWVQEASQALALRGKVPDSLLQLVQEFVFGTGLALMLLEREGTPNKATSSATFAEIN
uniref:Uncharacterized protein n=1 Tax=Lotharella globosa TaxID=91324 RepID=A0A7S3ZDA9_9EUKA|mmetsp:Transcript_2467/g.4814  ORF Transcript_2467/g.4814 Transcript_2467/m.4814 type:complete len:297 (+) Transcript_2467:67-957(+)